MCASPGHGAGRTPRALIGKRICKPAERPLYELTAAIPNASAVGHNDGCRIPSQSLVQRLSGDPALNEAQTPFQGRHRAGFGDSPKTGERGSPALPTARSSIIVAEAGDSGASAKPPTTISAPFRSFPTAADDPADAMPTLFRKSVQAFVSLLLRPLPRTTTLFPMLWYAAKTAGGSATKMRAYSAKDTCSTWSFTKAAMTAAGGCS